MRFPSTLLDFQSQFPDDDLNRPGIAGGSIS